jgi:hypothetical protein
MRYIDVFNGDADGICALHQLRLADPRESELVTGVKRDIALLKRVEADRGDRVTVLDISLDANRHDLLRLLANGARIRYFDHHFAGPVPDSTHFEGHIDTRSEVCTSLLVNDYLEGRYLPWAVAAAFGDNLHDSARHAAAPLNLSEDQLQALRSLGECINYNGYGAAVDDLFYAPDDLYRAVRPYADPFTFIAESEAYPKLRDGMAGDLEQARSLPVEEKGPGAAAVFLPDASWARRVSGVYANELARANRGRAHALLTGLADGAYLISVRAPLNNRAGAGELCQRFPTGGGREAAAGINHLPADQLDVFIDAFRHQYQDPV